MSIFSRLAKNIKRAITKVAPIVSIVAPFIPAVGPIVGTILGAVAGRAGSGATPGIAPPQVARPGIGVVAPAVGKAAQMRAQQQATFNERNRLGTNRGGLGTSPVSRARSPLSAVGRSTAVRTIAPPGPQFGGLRGPTPTALPAAPARPVIQPSPQRTDMSIFAALPALGGVAGRVASTVGRAVTGRAAGAAGLGVLLGQSLGGDGGACPSGWHLNKQDGVGGAAGTYCVRNRRMNVGNARAARRSVRRLKGARKLLRDIEKMMPSKPRARARAPQHHHHPAAGGN